MNSLQEKITEAFNGLRNAVGDCELKLIEILGDQNTMSLNSQQVELLEKFQQAFYGTPLAKEETPSKPKKTRKTKTKKAESKEDMVVTRETGVSLVEEDLDFGDGEDTGPEKEEKTPAKKVEESFEDADDFFDDPQDAAPKKKEELTEEELKEIRREAREKLRALSNKHGMDHPDIVALLTKHKLKSFVEAELKIMPDLLKDIKAVESKLG